MKLSLHDILKTEKALASVRPSPRTVWQRFLVPVDFTPGSRAALKVAVALAADPEDRITLVHVVEPEVPLQRGNEVMLLLRKSDAVLKAEAEDRLRRWADIEAGPDIEVDVLVRVGAVHREILAVAESRGSDLIVMSGGGRSWLERMCFGGVRRKVERRARCMVITVRPPVDRERPGEGAEPVAGGATTIPVSFGSDSGWSARPDSEREPVRDVTRVESRTGK